VDTYYVRRVSRLVAGVGPVGRQVLAQHGQALSLAANRGRPAAPDPLGDVGDRRLVVEPRPQHLGHLVGQPVVQRPDHGQVRVELLDRGRNVISRRRRAGAPHRGAVTRRGLTGAPPGQIAVETADRIAGDSGDVATRRLVIALVDSVEVHPGLQERLLRQVVDHVRAVLRPHRRRDHPRDSWRVRPVQPREPLLPVQGRHLPRRRVVPRLVLVGQRDYGSASVGVRLGGLRRGKLLSRRSLVTGTVISSAVV